MSYTKMSMSTYMSKTRHLFLSELYFGFFQTFEETFDIHLIKAVARNCNHAHNNLKIFDG